MGSILLNSPSFFLFLWSHFDPVLYPMSYFDYYKKNSYFDHWYLIFINMRDYIIATYKCVHKYEYNDINFIWYNQYIRRLNVGQLLKSLNLELHACLAKRRRCVRVFKYIVFLQITTSNINYTNGYKRLREKIWILDPGSNG